MKNIKSISKVRLKDSIKIIIVVIIVIILLILFPNVKKNYIKESNLYISEVMVKNTYTIKDDYNEYSDYIEIYNGYDDKINLSGYHLSDSELEIDKWTFPEITINPHEYLIVYASGKDNCDLKKRICHTKFKLSSKGEMIALTDKSGNIINKFYYPATSNDMSYGFTNNNYVLLDKPTPGSKNSKEFEYTNLSNKDIYVNEYMTHNKNVSYSTTGKYYDFIELYNNSNKDLTLHNVFLSDEKDNLMKYKLPDVTINKNDYLLLSLGDKSEVNNKEIITNFKLSDNETIIVSNGKKEIEILNVVELIDNVSYGKIEDKWYYFPVPTPGAINNTKSYEKIGDLN